MMHLNKHSQDVRPLELYKASKSKLSYDEWWDKTFSLKSGKISVKLEKDKWVFICRGGASIGAFELICTFKTLKIPFNSISYWLSDEYDEKDFIVKKL